jgi:hypothetical protein
MAKVKVSQIINLYYDIFMMHCENVEIYAAVCQKKQNPGSKIAQNCQLIRNSQPHE